MSAEQVQQEVEWVVVPEDDGWVLIDEEPEPCALGQGIRATSVAVVNTSKGVYAGVTTELTYEEEISKTASAFGVFVGSAVRLTVVVGAGIVSGVVVGLSAESPAAPSSEKKV